jgi:hypothetical protein
MKGMIPCQMCGVGELERRIIFVSLLYLLCLAVLLFQYRERWSRFAHPSKQVFLGANQRIVQRPTANILAIGALILAFTIFARRWQG